MADDFAGIVVLHLRPPQISLQIRHEWVTNEELVIPIEEVWIAWLWTRLGLSGLAGALRLLPLERPVCM